MNLFINKYNDLNVARNAELMECLRINNALGINVCEISDRPTFQDYFNEINKVAWASAINIIANSDIFFKDINYDWFANLTPNDCYALTRWDVLSDGTEKFYNNSGSQDTWVFRGPIKPVEGANFTQGIAGADNKIAYLLQQAEYIVTNPSLTIKTYHLHNSGIRHYNKKQKNGDIFRLPHPRINVPIIKL